MKFLLILVAILVSFLYQINAQGRNLRKVSSGGQLVEEYYHDKSNSHSVIWKNDQIIMVCKDVFKARIKEALSNSPLLDHIITKADCSIDEKAIQKWIKYRFIEQRERSDEVTKCTCTPKMKKKKQLDESLADAIKKAGDINIVISERGKYYYEVEKANETRRNGAQLHHITVQWEYE